MTASFDSPVKKSWYFCDWHISLSRVSRRAFSCSPCLQLSASYGHRLWRFLTFWSDFLLSKENTLLLQSLVCPTWVLFSLRTRLILCISLYLLPRSTPTHHLALPTVSSTTPSRSADWPLVIWPVSSHLEERAWYTSTRMGERIRTRGSPSRACGNRTVDFHEPRSVATDIS